MSFLVRLARFTIKPEKMLIMEDASIQIAMLPYWNTEHICEEIIIGTAKVTDLKAISPRYFYPIVVYPSPEIGELPIGVLQNLVPFITQAGLAYRKEWFVYGDDYPKSDGTCVHDYIYLVDLAKAYVIVLKWLLDKKNSAKVETFNLGTGIGSIVMEVIHFFEKVSKKNYLIKLWIVEQEILFRPIPRQIKQIIFWTGG